MRLSFIWRRLLTALPVLVGIVTIAFVVTHAVPGDPLAMLLGEDATEEQYAQLSQRYGLDRSMWQQWLGYVTQVARGEFGFSLRTGRAINADLWQYFAASLELGLAAFILATIVGVPAGIYAAVRQDRLADHVLRVITLGGVAAPVFWSALMAQWIFYGVLDWLPGTGQLSDFLLFTNPPTRITGFMSIDALLAGNVVAFNDVLRHMILPASVLAYRVVAVVARMTRSVMVDALGEDHIRTAHSLGIHPRTIVVRHALKNAMPPILTVLGLAFGQLLQGSILVETVFAWPGMGLYAVQGILNLDYPVVIGVSVLICLLYVVANLVVDLLYPVFDPRIQYT